MDNFINQWTPSDFNDHIDKIIGKKVNVKSIEIAGDGNMNFTYRLRFEDQGSIIVKQSPPFCARFPDIPAPEARIISEFKYYELATKNDYLSDHSPALLGLDKANRIAYISDLGSATDFEYLYGQDKKLDKVTCQKLINYLISLHNLNIPESVSFDNLDMRKLNHEYIFHLPFLADNFAIDLDTVTNGLEKVARPYKIDPDLKKAAKELGELYFQKTRILIHGDYYPMSWIETNKGLFIIDPEFAFMGLPEIDLGVFLAHMVMSNNFALAYNTINEVYGDYDVSLMAKFCAVEVIRRITYVSQLPLLNSLSFKSELLSISVTVLKTGKIDLYENIDCISS
ncbi:MAG: phosphotransferase [Kordiimonadaceae bacterium]|nr:phosphotransferase [Kordiimonadaceae bacterium]MBT6032554.1 phosphotransferase [Kordiimonadaceae bacterium]